jgi:hypothetical protein
MAHEGLQRQLTLLAAIILAVRSYPSLLLTDIVEHKEKQAHQSEQLLQANVSAKACRGMAT